jgi:hypothetical protein
MLEPVNMTPEEVEGRRRVYMESKRQWLEDGMKLEDMLQKAQKEGRTCKHCGWFITKEFHKRNKSGYCANCHDAMKGVNVNTAGKPFADEGDEMTGEML